MSSCWSQSKAATKKICKYVEGHYLADDVKTSKNCEAQYKQQANIVFQLLPLSQEQSQKIDMRKLMKYPLMPVPSSIGTPEAYLLKTDKSERFTCLTKELDNLTMLSDAQTLNVEDGSAIFCCIGEVRATFKQIVGKYTMSVSWESLISYLALTCARKIR